MSAAGTSTTICTSAPVRLDFAGAWTDVAPFANEARGVVVNAAIDLRTRVELTIGQQHYDLWAHDLNERVTANTADELTADGKLGLLAAAIRRSRTGPCWLHTSAEAPVGSGLGTSGALSVALARAFAAANYQGPGRIELAEEAWNLETVDAAVAAGKQDQYAAAMGGFQQLIFDQGSTEARVLELDAAFAAKLAEHTVVCYTGQSRFSGATITRVMDAYARRDRVVVKALHAIAELGDAMAHAFIAGDLLQIGEIMRANWREQQRLDAGMRTADMARLEMAMLAAGAIGGKAAGAGTGGSMFFIVPGEVAQAVDAAATSGARVLPVRWADRGVSLDPAI